MIVTVNQGTGRQHNIDVRSSLSLPRIFAAESPRTLNVAIVKREGAVEPLLCRIDHDGMFVFFRIRVNPLFKAYRLGVCAHVLKCCKRK